MTGPPVVDRNESGRNNLKPDNETGDKNPDPWKQSKKARIAGNLFSGLALEGNKKVISRRMHVPQCWWVRSRKIPRILKLI